MSRSLFARLHQRFGPPVDLASRRRFLKVAAATGAGMLMSCAGVPRGMDGSVAWRGDRRRVVIVGGGFAGLACAYELLAGGGDRFDVIVLEARNRVGGRVLTLHDVVPARTVEGGGEFIGANHPLWVLYAQRFGLSLRDVTEEESLDSPVFVLGERLTGRQAERLYHEMALALVSINVDSLGVDAQRPWLSPGAEALDARSVQEWLDELDVSTLCRAALATQLASDNAQSLERQSYLAQLAQVKGGGIEAYWTQSEAYRCKGGNDMLSRALAAGIGTHRIRLNSPVTAIEQRGDRVLVRTGSAGETIECEDVVLAVPPSVWDRIMVSPGLPEHMQVQMGPGIKYLASVSHRFWRERGMSPYSLSDGPLTFTWDSTDNQRGEAACMAAFSGGDAAHAARGLHRHGCRAELARRYPGLSAAFVRDRFMDWPRDRWAGGAYSFPAPGQITAIGDGLEQGFGRLHFAGEHTSYAFVGYMEGALQSGAAAARRIAGNEMQSARVLEEVGAAE